MDDNKNIIYETQKELFRKSINGEKHHRLFQKVLDEKNIRYAISRISSNSGRNTPGPNGVTFEELMKKPHEDVIQCIKCELTESKKRFVRQVEIPKSNGKTRKLGIANIEERIAQQCVLNILESILEPNYSHRSYGFRRNLNTKQCVSRMALTLTVMKHEKWIYDCDLTDFFGSVRIDNVLDLLRKNHNICDGRFLKLIKELMWLNIKKGKQIIEYQGVGLAQGTILGPVLANVQFDDFERLLKSIEGDAKMKDYSTQHIYRNHNTREQYIKWRNKKYPNKFNITMYRYADDFVLISNNQWDLEEVIKILKKWLFFYSLSTNDDKTKIIHGKNVKLDFLGYHIKAGNDGLIISIKNYAKKKKEIGKIIKENLKLGNVEEINEIIIGTYYYYDIATNLVDLSQYISKVIYKMSKRTNLLCKIIKVPNHDAYKIIGKTGKEILVDTWTLRRATSKSTKWYVMNTNYWTPNETCRSDIIEWCDKVIKNRSKYTNAKIINFILGKVKQQKREPILRVDLLDIDPKEIEIHHKIPRNKGGSDDFNNLIFLHRRVHQALHANHECESGWNKQYYNRLRNILNSQEQ